jgi:hypothetical protein
MEKFIEISKSICIKKLLLCYLLTYKRMLILEQCTNLSISLAITYASY